MKVSACVGRSVVVWSGRSCALACVSRSLCSVFTIVGCACSGILSRMLTILSLSLTHKHTHLPQLSIDEGRITSRLPESGPISISSLTLGSDSPSLSSGRFSGCLSSLVLNSGRIDLAAALASGAAAPFNTSSEGGAVGCDGGEGCEGVECPSGSTCQAGWQNHSCVCDSNLQPRNSHCLNPCTPNPCRNGGVCLVIPSGSTCDCQPGFQGGVCEEVIGAGCPTGFHSPPSSAPCQRCTCAPQGVTAEVCDASSGQCFCQVSLRIGFIHVCK